MGFCRDCQKKQPFITEPKLLVFKEKHGERYFYIPDDKTLFAAALKVLTQRHGDGYWFYAPEKPLALDFTAEQVAALPENLRVPAELTLRKYMVAMGLARQFVTC
jgi:hypothetical protein